MGNMERTNFQNNQFAPKRKDLGQFILSADQTSNISDTNPVKFDCPVVNNGIDFNAGTYTFTLKANKTYKLDGRLKCTFGATAAAFLYYRWYNVTGAAYFGATGASFPVNSSTANSDPIYALATITPIVDTQIQLRLITSSNLSSLVGAYTYGTCTAIIEEFISFEQPNTYPYEMNADQVDLIVTGTNWTTTRAVGRVKKTKNDKWILEGNIRGSVSTPTQNITLTIAGVTFKNISNFYQAVNANQEDSPSKYFSYAYVTPNTSTLVMAFSGTTAGIGISFNVELDSKPNWI